jgi:hypothetical protein
MDILLAMALSAAREALNAKSRNPTKRFSALPPILALQWFLALGCIAPFTSSAAFAETSWLALTMAPNGDWGTGVASHSYLAIAQAVRHCQDSSKRPGTATGCGGIVRTRQNGWGIAVACKDTWFVTVGESRRAAELALREWQTRNAIEDAFVIAACQRVAVRPDGSKVDDNDTLGFSIATVHAE